MKRKMGKEMDRPYKLLEEFLEQQNPTEEELVWVIRNVRVDSLKEKAGRMLLQRDPSNKALSYVVSDIQSLREEAAQRLLKQDPNKEELWCIFECMEDNNTTLALKAGEKLLAQLEENEFDRLFNWCRVRREKTNNKDYQSFEGKAFKEWQGKRKK